MYVNNREEIEYVYCGDIVVVVGFKDIVIGDIFCVENVLIVFE